MDEKLQTVLKYAGNDQERARKIMSGDLKDVRVVNGVFSMRDADLFGQFQLFFNTDDESLMNITLVLFNDPHMYEKIQIEDTWKLFHTKVKQSMEAESVLDAEDFIEHLTESIEGYQLALDVVDHDTESVEMTIEEIVKKSFSVDDVECSVTINDISTLDMVENDIPIGKVPRKKPEAEPAAEEDDRFEIEKQAQFTVNCSLLIAPVSGKYIHDIVPGDLLKVMMNDRNNVTRKIATALNALDEEGNFLPIKGRVKQIIPLPGGG
ncbi:MAG: hypothetical protein ACOCWH_05830, partial [Spirochaetota bacterium]